MSSNRPAANRSAARIRRETEEVKRKIAAIISRTLQEIGISQRAAARVTGLTQPDISEISRGRCEGFSIERLLHIVMMLGSDVELSVGRTSVGSSPTIQVTERRSQRGLPSRLPRSKASRG